MHTSDPTGTSQNLTTFLFGLFSHSEQLSVLPGDTVLSGNQYHKMKDCCYPVHVLVKQRQSIRFSDKFQLSTSKTQKLDSSLC